MATYSSILAWRIPWTEGPGGLQSIGSQGESDMTEETSRTQHASGPCLKVQSLSCVRLFVTPWTVRTVTQQPVRLLHPWDFPSKNTKDGCYFLLQVIFPTQG